MAAYHLELLTHLEVESTSVDEAKKIGSTINRLIEEAVKREIASARVASVNSRTENVRHIKRIIQDISKIA